MKNFILVGCNLLILPLYSQALPYKDNLFLKSPDIAQLSKYTDIPAITYTGAVTVDIPLYEVNTGGYKLPISLKYHASGIKVKEIATKVGLGWSLDIGGIMLSKQIFGNEDKGWIPNLKQDDGAFQPNNRTQSGDFNTAVEITGFNIADPSDISSFIRRKRDTQPDIFTYSLKNETGDFYINSAGKPTKIGESNIKIGASPFVLTDAMGNQYFFSQANHIRNTGGAIPTSENRVSTDYKVDKIVLANKEEINFDYLSISYEYKSNHIRENRYPLNQNTSMDGVVPNVEFKNFTTRTEVLSENVIKQISYPSGIVKFNYKDGRLDLPGSLILDEVIAFNKKGDVITHKKIHTSYFLSDGHSDYPHDTSITRRLKLDSVVDEKSNQIYNLEYYNENPLPHRLSDATDYVGFYNGQTNNSGIPFVEWSGKIYGNGDNKEPDINFAVSGSLKEMRYPTGGKLILDYELDDFSSDLPAVSIKEVYESIYSGDADKIITPLSNDAKLFFKVDFSSNTNPDGDSGSLPEVGSQYFIAQILDPNKKIMSQFVVNGSYELFLDKRPYYILRMLPINRPSSEKYARLDLYWHESKQIPNVLGYKSFGGIRVKKISNNDLEENYIYRDENNKSTGIFMGDPINYYYFSTEPLGYMGEQCEYLIISNTGNFNISTINGKPTLYNKVTTEKKSNVDPKIRWKTVDVYLNSPSTNVYDPKSPFFTFTNNQFARGILTERYVYNSDDRIVKYLQNIYDADPYFNSLNADYVARYPELLIRPYQISISSISKERDWMSTSSYYYIPTFAVKRFEIPSAWMKLKKQQIVHYLTNGKIEEEIDYAFNNSYQHLSPTRVIKVSNEDTFDTAYSYAHEKGNQKLIDANMVGVALETEVKKNGITMSKTETRYDDPTHLFPTAQWAYDTAKKNLSEEVTYDRYDEKGNLLQYTTKTGISTIVIWGYNKTQPIAKIEGAKLSDIPGSLITELQDASDYSNASYSETGLITKLDGLLKTYPQFQITTYTYQPLVGVTSITPPSGLREVYEYDSAGRLKSIKDHNGRELKKYEYHYKMP